MARPRKTLEKRRVQIRLSERQAEIFDAYSIDEINKIFAIALDTIRPENNATTTPDVILRPQSVVTESIARFCIKQGEISIFLPEKRDDFRVLVKGFGFQWNDIKWRRVVDESVAIDRAAEIAYRVMAIGISVQVGCEELKRKIITGQFQLEPRHQIRLCNGGTYDGWFTFRWPKDEDWYDKIMRITAAKYADGWIRVPPEIFAEVEDFAEINGFSFTDAARSALETARANQPAILTVEIRSIKSRVRKSGRKNVDGIPDHLKDDTP